MWGRLKFPKVSYFSNVIGFINSSVRLFGWHPLNRWAIHEYAGYLWKSRRYFTFRAGSYLWYFDFRGTTIYFDTPSYWLLPAILTVLSIALVPMMSSNDQKRFKRFTHFTPPKFVSAIKENAYKFSLNTLESLHNLISLESHGVVYMTY